jgi:NifU-like protein involved in Fe-S cluster formation
MSTEPYNDAVRRRFENPLHAGDADARYPAVVTAEVSESDAGFQVRLAAEMDDNEIRRLRFRVFGCPHLIAAAEELCSRFEGRLPQALQDVPVTQLMELLEVPVEKTGRMLLLEDAAHSLARAILAGEPSGARRNRRD